MLDAQHENDNNNKTNATTKVQQSNDAQYHKHSSHFFPVLFHTWATQGNDMREKFMNCIFFIRNDLVLYWIEILNEST